MPTTMPIEATFSWIAPAKYFFEEGSFRESDDKKKVLDQISADAGRVVLKSASLEAIEEHYNVSDCTDFCLDGKLVHAGDSRDDLAPEGNEKRVKLTVSVKGVMQANNGPGAMRSWAPSEIFDEIRTYSKPKSGKEFEIKASYVK